ncbi:MAG: hypothetical protein AB7F43_09345 [Bacteriovoracia bacterium]
MGIRIILLFNLLFLIFFLGCAKERTIEDWEKEKVAEDLAKLQEVRGNYQGTLVSKKDGQAIGPMTLNFRPDTRFAGKNTSTNGEVAVLKVTLTVHGISGGSISFQDTFYDPASKEFRTSFAYRAGNGTINLDLSGFFQGNAVEGELVADGFSDTAATFHLEKDAALPQVSTPDRAEKETEIFEGEGKYNDGSIKKMKFTIMHQVKTNEQKLIDMLVPIKYVQVAWAFTNDLVILFPDAQLDERVGSIVGRTEHSTSATRTVLTLNCQKIAKEQKKGFHCLYSNSHTASTIMADFF